MTVPWRGRSLPQPPPSPRSPDSPHRDRAPRAGGRKRCSSRQNRLRCRSRRTAPSSTRRTAVWRSAEPSTTRRRSPRRIGLYPARPHRSADTWPHGRSYPCPRPDLIRVLHQRNPLPHVGRLVRQLAVSAFHPDPDPRFVEGLAEQPFGGAGVPCPQPTQSRAEHPQPNRCALGGRFEVQRLGTLARIEQRLL